MLTQLLSGADAFKQSSRGGVEAAAEILNYLDDSVEASVSSHIRETDADLAQRIQDKMFAFDHLVDLDDRAVQSLLREVHSETLIVAMKGASEELKDKIFKNMSGPAAEMLRDDLEAKGPVRLSRGRSGTTRDSAHRSATPRRGRSDCPERAEEHEVLSNRIIPKERAATVRKVDLSLLAGGQLPDAASAAPGEPQIDAAPDPAELIHARELARREGMEAGPA